MKMLKLSILLIALCAATARGASPTFPQFDTTTMNVVTPTSIGVKSNLYDLAGTAKFLSASNESQLFLLTAANNATNFFIDRANGAEQLVVCAGNVNLAHLTNSLLASVNANVTVYFLTTNTVSPVVSMPTNWHYGVTNGYALVGSTYQFTITNIGIQGKMGSLAVRGFGTGTSQSNVYAGSLGGQP